MRPYSSNSGKPTGVTAYEAGNTFIIIAFQNGAKYRYTYRSAGEEHVAAMKLLAERQNGLSTYISMHHPAYEDKY